MRKYIRKNLNRSGSSICDICGEKHILVIHHIKGRDGKDSEKFYNKANICSNCHNKIHHGLIIVEKWIKTSEGLELFWHHKGESSTTGEDSYPPLISEAVRF